MSNIILPPTAQPGQLTLQRSDGHTETAELPALTFTHEEARTLRAMKRILQKYRWQCVYRCIVCQQAPGGRVGWVDGGVLDDAIMFACGHQMVVFKGQTG